MFIYRHWHQQNPWVSKGITIQQYKLLTDIYDRVPTNEFAMESINCPLTPKSQIFISPREFTSILEGLTSATENGIKKSSSMNLPAEAADSLRCFSVSL